MEGAPNPPATRPVRIIGSKPGFYKVSYLSRYTTHQNSPTREPEWVPKSHVPPNLVSTWRQFRQERIAFKNSRLKQEKLSEEPLATKLTDSSSSHEPTKSTAYDLPKLAPQAESSAPISHDMSTATVPLESESSTKAASMGETNVPAATVENQINATSPLPLSALLSAHPSNDSIPLSSVQFLPQTPLKNTNVADSSTVPDPMVPENPVVKEVIREDEVPVTMPPPTEDRAPEMNTSIAEESTTTNVKETLSSSELPQAPTEKPSEVQNDTPPSAPVRTSRSGRVIRPPPSETSNNDEKLSSLNDKISGLKEELQFTKEMYREASLAASKAGQELEVVLKENDRLKQQMRTVAQTQSEFKSMELESWKREASILSAQLHLLQQQQAMTSDELRHKASLWDRRQEEEKINAEREKRSASLGKRYSDAFEPKMSVNEELLSELAELQEEALSANNMHETPSMPQSTSEMVGHRESTRVSRKRFAPRDASKPLVQDDKDEPQAQESIQRDGAQVANNQTSIDQNLASDSALGTSNEPSRSNQTSVTIPRGGIQEPRLEHVDEPRTSTSLEEVTKQDRIPTRHEERFSTPMDQPSKLQDSSKQVHAVPMTGHTNPLHQPEYSAATVSRSGIQHTDVASEASTSLSSVSTNTSMPKRLSSSPVSGSGFFGRWKRRRKSDAP